MSWETLNLGEFLNLKRGYDLPSSQRKDGYIPIISSSGITGYHATAKVKGPGVVTGRYGTLGKVFFVSEDYWPLNTSLYVQDFKGNDPRFTAYFLRSVLSAASSNKAAVPGVNRNDLHAKKVSVTRDVGQQTEIASILATYDALIENNQRRIQLLEQSARLLYKEWFVHLRFPGHEDVKVVDGVPEGWAPGKIADIGEVVTGKTPSKKNESFYGGPIPFIKTPDMHGNTLVTKVQEYLSEEGANSQASKTLPPRSILVSCIGTVGAVSFNCSSSQTNQQINAILPGNESLRYWTFFMAKELKPLLEGMGGGATMANVNKSKFSSIEVVIPSKRMLDQFNSFITTQVDQIERLSLINIQLTQARDLLLPRLMSGKISV